MCLGILIFSFFYPKISVDVCTASWVFLIIHQPVQSSVPIVHPQTALSLPALFCHTPVLVPCCPPLDASSNVVLSAVAVDPCLYHGCLFLPSPGHLFPFAQTSRSGHRATHCATAVFGQPMYVAYNTISTACSTL